jgi:hypothetical protein
MEPPLMQTRPTVAEPQFEGSTDQRELAGRLFSLFQARGRFFSDRAPIRLTLSQLTEYMQQQEPRKKDWSARIDAALSASSDVFEREAMDDDVAFVTTRAGLRPASEPLITDRPMLARRFATPEPKREIQPTRRSVVRPSLPVPDFLRSADETPIAWEVVEPRTPAEAAAAARARSVVPELPSLDEILAEQPVIVARAAAAIEVSTASEEDVAEAVRTALSRELAVANWGDLWMAEDRVQRFSRGDLHRIEGFLREQDGIASDEDIVQDILGIRPSAAEYSSTRFALNYRMSRETKEFEYIGTDTEGLWALTNLPQIGATKRKPAEIGQDYRFLLDYQTPEPGLEEGLVEHILSFYEYTHGVLPLDASLATIMPKAGFAEQRAARLFFESPQTNEEVVAELRFPTANRGGFIAGLAEFFAENLIPGAVVTIERTERSNRFLLEYFQVSGEDRKLLHLDERKGKYSFRSTTFYCATQDEYVLSEHRYPKLADVKPLDERAKRRPEQAVAVAFERVGENVGTSSEPRYMAMLTDLLAVANVERPVSSDLLRDILTGGTHVEFSADESTEDVFYYSPPTA